MKKALLVLLAAACLLLNGCQASVPVIAGDGEPVATLQPAQMLYDAPIGDAELTYDALVTLYLPRKDGVRLVATQETVQLSAGRHGAESVIRALFGHPGNETVAPLSAQVKLQLAGENPVEVSRDVATVNLAASALQLDYKDYYTVCQAITNTLTEFTDIRYVNVLVSGAQVGLDVSASLPMGTLQRRTGEDLNTLWEQAQAQRVQLSQDASLRRLSIAATLYFPAKMSTGILPEVRNLAFEGQTPAQLVSGLLQELSQGAEYLGDVPSLPDLSELLSQPPQVSELVGVAGRKVVLHFSSELNEALIENDVTRSACMASLTYTFTTFLPGVTGVEVYIGDEWIQSVTPSSIYTDREPIDFQNGLQARADYRSFLLGYCRLYFATDAGRLRAVNRPVPYYQAKSPRFLLLQLMQGPKGYDDIPGLKGVLPDGLGDADLLGISLKGNTLLVHFSQALSAKSQGLSGNQERLLIYAMVNTLCENPILSRIRFYVAGAQPETLAGEIYLPGEFLSNPGFVE